MKRYRENIPTLEERSKMKMENLEFYSEKIPRLQKKSKMNIENSNLTMNIDSVLENYGLFRLQNFAYVMGDCLFNAFEVLLHFRYTSIEIRERVIEHFRACLQKRDEKAIESYQVELNSHSLMEMHKLTDPKVYLNKMSKSTTTNIAPNDRGLWGDGFCIHWASNWLKIPIQVWLKTKGTVYFHFNWKLTTYTYGILFHDENWLVGHFEPLLWKRNIITSSNFEENEVEKIHMSESTYGESCFETLCELHDNEYNVACLRCIVSQTFCNAIMQNDSFAIGCIQKYINHDVIKNVPKIANWQGYMIQLTLSYKEGNIEGGLFVLCWLARALNIEIHLWSSKTGKMTTSIPSFAQPSKVFDIVEIQRDIVVYVPLTIVQTSTNKKLKLCLTNQS